MLMCGDLSASCAAGEQQQTTERPDPRIPITIALYRNR